MSRPETVGDRPVGTRTAVRLPPRPGFDAVRRVERTPPVKGRDIVPTGGEEKKLLFTEQSLI